MSRENRAISCVGHKLQPLQLQQRVGTSDKLYRIANFQLPLVW